MHKQSHIQNLTLSTIASLKTVTEMTEGQICLTRDNNTIYRYIASGSAYTADDKFVLTTADGGNTRWIGIGGKYNINAIFTPTVSTLSLIKSLTAQVEGDLCTCIETETTYRYLTLGSAYTANDTSILITGNGGNTRWIGMSGKYSINTSSTGATSVATLVALKALSATEGQIITCIETSTVYRFLTAGSALVADDKMVVTTVSGGDTRWVGVAGTYGFYGTTTDYTKFEADGTMVAVGGAICYRDEYPSQWLTPSSGPATLATVSVGGVSTRKYAFNGTATVNTLCASFEIPHDMAVAQVNAGTLPLEIHIHFAPSGFNTGIIRWVINWCQNRVNSNAQSQTPIEITRNITQNNAGWNLLSSDNLAIPSGGWTIGDLIEFNITRDPSNAGDTHPDPAILYQVALHVPVDTLGSRTTYTK
jgi:hypothetical protein